MQVWVSVDGRVKPGHDDYSIVPTKCNLSAAEKSSTSGGALSEHGVEGQTVEMKIGVGLAVIACAIIIVAAANPGRAEQPSPLLLAQAAEPAKKPAAPKTPAKPAAAPAKPAPKPALKPEPVVVTDDPAIPYIRLDSRLRETVYEMRYSLTTIVTRASGARQYLLAVQVTHHDETPRHYARAERDGAVALAMTETQRPSRQCTRNRDKTQACFHDEAYVVELPEAYLAAGRKSGLTLRLSAASAPPMTLMVEAAMIDAQLAATERTTAKK